MIKGIVFDLDGVIISTDQFHYEAWKAIADQEGIYYDRRINNRTRGVSRMDSLNILLEKANRDYSFEEKVNLANQKNELYKKMLNKLSPECVSSDVRDTLFELRKMGYLLALGSASKNALFILDKIGMKEAFDQIIDGSMVTKSKPDPEIFLKAAESLKLDSKDCLVVEDAKSGIDAAKAGGFLTAGILDAAKYKKTDFPINKISDILEILYKRN